MIDAVTVKVPLHNDYITRRQILLAIHNEFPGMEVEVFKLGDSIVNPYYVRAYPRNEEEQTMVCLRLTSLVNNIALRY